MLFRSNNVVITLPSAQPIAAGVTTFFNVNTNNALGTFVSSNSTGTTPATRPSVVATSTNGEVVYAAVAIDGDGAATPPPVPTIGANQSQLWTNAAQNRLFGASSTQPGAASVTNSWTWSGNNQQWTIAAVPIKPAPVVGGPTNTTSFAQTPAFQSSFTIAAGDRKSTRLNSSH